MLDDYVTVYDNRPFDEYKKNYAQVGFGVKSSKDIKSPTKSGGSANKKDQHTAPKPSKNSKNDKNTKNDSQPAPASDASSSLFSTIFGSFAGLTSGTSFFTKFYDWVIRNTVEPFVGYIYKMLGIEA